VGIRSGADAESDRDPPVVHDLVVDQRADDGEHHSHRRLLHPTPRALGRVRLRSPRMNRTDATRYVVSMKSVRAIGYRATDDGRSPRVQRSQVQRSQVQRSQVQRSRVRRSSAMLPRPRPHRPVTWTPARPASRCARPEHPEHPSVIRNPPTTLTVADATAMNPRTVLTRL